MYTWECLVAIHFDNGEGNRFGTVNSEGILQLLENV